MEIKTKRIWLPAEEADGYRILVDRLWPRGLSKCKASVDLWAKTLAPTDALRKWFGHEPERFPEFADRYVAELQDNPDYASFVEEVNRHERVTLVYAARNEACNNAVVLAQLLSASSLHP